jgi:hypothetical protein
MGGATLVVGSISLDMPLPGSPAAMRRGSRPQLATLLFLGPRGGQLKIVMTPTSLGMGAVLFPAGFPPVYCH